LLTTICSAWAALAKAREIKAAPNIRLRRILAMARLSLSTVSGGLILAACAACFAALRHLLVQGIFVIGNRNRKGRHGEGR
jgi:hypothetical protein